MNKHVYADHLRKSVTENASRPCFHIKRKGVYQSWTYADFHRDLNRLSSVLRDLGLKQGVNAAVIGENTPEWMIAYHAIMLTGGRTVPIDPNLPETEIREIIRQTEAQVVFCSPIYEELFTAVSREFSFPKNIVVLDPLAPESPRRFDKFCALGDPDDDAFSREFKPEDELAVLFTSGTTGRAKGVVLNQRNLTAVQLHGVPRMKVTVDDTMVAILPLHHVFGFAACGVAALTTGFDVVYVPVIKGPLILEALNDKKVSILPAVPQMLELFYNNINRKVADKGPVVKTVFGMLKGVSKALGPLLGTGFRAKLFHSVHEGFGGSLSLVISGGSSLKAAYFEGFKLMGFDIVEGYGLTETFGPITICPRDDRRQASVGPVFPDNEMKIAEPNDEGIGEVLFRGATVFPGYYKNEKATEAVFDSEGWFHTGDLGRATGDGFLYLTGRSKDIIVLSSGKNVYPDEIEEFYASSPMIEEIAVFGTIEAGDEVVTAVIVPSKDIRRKYKPARATDVLNEEIAGMSSSLPTYKKIGRFVAVYQPLPRTTTKKLKKPEIQKLYQELRKGPEARELPAAKLSFLESQLMDSTEYRVLVDFICSTLPNVKREMITPRSSLEIDLGLDSLKSLDLVCMIEEKFDCSVPVEALLKIETVGDAAALAQDLHGTGKDAADASTQSVSKRMASAKSSTAAYPENTSPVFRLTGSVCMLLSKLLWGVKIDGKRNVPSDKPVILASNHESLLDAVWLGACLPWKIRKRTYTTGKVELTRVPLLSSFLKRSNMIMVERQGDVLEALSSSIAALKDSKNLIIFPEGTRTRTGEMGAFKSGVGTLMLETDAAVVPVRVRGSFKLWPPDKGPQFFGGHAAKPNLTIGVPLSLDDLKRRASLPDTPTPEQVADAVQEVVKSM